jgi:hypothetical protein
MSQGKSIAMSHSNYWLAKSSKEGNPTKVCLTDKTVTQLGDYIALERKHTRLFNDYCLQKEVGSKEAYSQQLQANAEALHRAALLILDNTELIRLRESLERPPVSQLQWSRVGGLEGLYPKIAQGRLTREEFFIVLDRVKQKAQEHAVFQRQAGLRS